jgi:hypothetical protein
VDGGRIRISDDEPLRRTRLAVLFRAALFVPPAVVIAIWSAVAALALVPAWAVLLVRGRPSERLHHFLTAYVRYVGQAAAWFHLLSERYPNPRRAREHPFAVHLPEPSPQPRAITLFRIVPAIPALVLASALGVVLALSAVASWFAGVALGRTTAGLQELGTFCLRYELESIAYVLLLTSRYPRLAPE